MNANYILKNEQNGYVYNNLSTGESTNDGVMVFNRLMKDVIDK